MYTFLLERIPDRLIVVIYTQILGRYFLKNKENETNTSRKTNDNVCCL